MALTADEISYIRAKSGDTCTPPVVSDALLQVYFDSVGGSLPCTIASVLEDRWAAVKAGASKLTDFGTSVDTSEMDHIEDLLNYWRPQCGLSGIGSSSTFTYRADSRQTEAPTFTVEES